MKPINKTVQFVVWGVLSAIVLGLLVAWLLLRDRNNTPPLPILGSIPTFQLTDQAGRAFTEANLRNQVAVFNIIFTRCGGPCPRITAQMKEIQDAIPPGLPVRFVSLTSDPEYDSPEKLRDYGARYQADFGRWWFVTGGKSELYDFAIKGLHFTVIDNQEAATRSMEDLFIHSLKFVVVDRQGRIRAYLDGGEPDTVKTVRAAVRRLLREKAAP